MWRDGENLQICAQNYTGYPTWELSKKVQIQTWVLFLDPRSLMPSVEGQTSGYGSR